MDVVLDVITVPAGAPFQRVSGIGRSRQYELIAKGDLDSVLDGRRRLIFIASYLAYLGRLREREAVGQQRPSPNPKAANHAPGGHEPRVQATGTPRSPARPAARTRGARRATP